MAKVYCLGNLLGFFVAICVWHPQEWSFWHSSTLGGKEGGERSWTVTSPMSIFFLLATGTLRCFTLPHFLFIFWKYVTVCLLVFNKLLFSIHLLCYEDVFVLKGWSLLPNALWPFKIYCAPPNLGIRTSICRLKFAQRPIFSGLRFFNEPEIPDSGPPV